MSKQCPICGEYKNRQSKKCRACYFRQIKSDKYITKTCPVCSETFTTHQVQINRGGGKYCSLSCARKGSPTRKRNRAIVICQVCKKQIERHHSEIKKSVKGLYFCSSDCWYEHNQGENHYLWAGGQNERVNPNYTKWRKAVLERDKYYCRICHSQDRLEVHHIKRFATHPDIRWNIDNGLTLCHDCHIGFRNREEEYTDMLNTIRQVKVEVWYV